MSTNPKRFYPSEEMRLLPATPHSAKALGVKYYYTGLKCRRGHFAPRYASSGNCVECYNDDAGQVVIKLDRVREDIAKAQEALKEGSMTYVPSSPCARGHLLRYVGSNGCVECDRLGISRFKISNPNYDRKRYLKKTYGLDLDDYELLLKNQQGLCKICEEEMKTPHIDHCHRSGKIRGLLCSKCNQAIGLLKESEALFLKAVEYLRGA